MFLKAYFFIFLFFVISLGQGEYLRPCYYTDWSHYSRKYEPEMYEPGLCTHIFFAFAKITSDYQAEAYDPADLPSGPNGGYFARVNKLKEKQPGLKTLISFGGWTAGTSVFKPMAADGGNRQKFINSAIAFADQYGFDGIDIDWEYPDSNDKANYATFMKELKSAAGSKLVTAAVSADSNKVTQGYDVPSLAQSLDFVNVMTYDFHGSWEQVTGENSPLYTTDNFNTDYAMKFWAQQGMPKNKLLVGLGSYGHGWTLTDPNNHGIGAPGQASPAQPFTQEAGTAAYYEICKLGGTRYWLDDQKVPYVVAGNLWFGYDDVQSITVKTQYIKDNGFGGGFVWTLDDDDFNGVCGGEKYPILKALKAGLNGNGPGPTNGPTEQPPTNKPTNKPPNTTSNPGGPFKCPSPDGFFSDPVDCTKYYQCANNYPFHMSCPPGTEWNEKEKTCEWPANTTCFQKK